MNAGPVYDVVIVGGGFAGAILAKELTAAGRSVLLLEAGSNGSLGPENYAARVQQYYAAGAKVPNSPYPQEVAAPQADVLDLPSQAPWPKPWTKGYLVQNGPQPFGSDYVRSLGGTSLHWHGETLRMVPNDFQMRTLYGHGIDWPITYADIEPYYCRAEAELGVAANVADQRIAGIWFQPGYAFPMYQIPLSYSDTYLQTRLAGLSVQVDGANYPTVVGSTPVARNSIPNPAHVPSAPVAKTDEKADQKVDPKASQRTGSLFPSYQPVGMVGDPLQGQRCQGNSSCIPICPVQAKYVALKTLESSDKSRLTVVTQAVAYKVSVDGSGKVTGMQYFAYDAAGARQAMTAVGAVYILACNAIENAKLLLMSGIANAKGQVGKNLMDHPYPLIWATLKDVVGTFRGPGSTSGIDTMRDGPFRKNLAAFRVTISNWGWNFAAGSPVSDVRDLVTPVGVRRRYVTRAGHTPAAMQSGKGPGVFGRALRRAVYNRVNRQLQMGMLVEQDPEATNQVTLSKIYFDPLGLPRPEIRYDLSTYTKAGIAASVSAARQMFKLLGAHDETAYAADDPQAFSYEGHLYAWRGAGHIVGTHRMGPDSCGSVVNSNGRCWQHPNLYLAGAGVMPTIGTANPTLTLCALAYRTADAILAQLRSQ